MSTRLDEQRLRRMIREEYYAITPVKRGELMTEARAELVAAELLEEGLFANIKALFSGLKAGAGKSAEKLGDKAAEKLKPVGQFVQNVKKQAAQGAKDFAAFVNDVSDAAVKSALEARVQSMKSSVQAAIKKEISGGLQDLVKAGMDEKDAKGIISVAVQAAIADISAN